MELSMAKRIGEVARVAGVGVETVRFYEREGLIDQPPKPLRGWREYDEAARSARSTRSAWRSAWGLRCAI
jgi:MerR family mercuric resistance operon transcriptional regulator